MEPRKVIQFGNSSYVVTLPQEWVKKNKLDKSNYVNIAENGNHIIISTLKEKIEKRAIIDLNNKPLKIFNRELISYYLKNYKYIEIKCENCLEKIEEIRILKEKLSSVEIVEIGPERVVLKDLTSPEEMKLDVMIDEIVEMQKIIFKELCKEEVNSFLIKKLDSNINRLTFLAWKCINYNLDMWKEPQEVKNAIYYWRIVASFEATGDIVKRLARYLKEVEKGDQQSKINEVIQNVDQYYIFLTSLLKPNVNVSNNLKVYLDKKQSLLKEFEDLREDMQKDLNLYFVITQLLKDILGQLDNVLISIIDLNCN